MGLMDKIKRATGGDDNYDEMYGTDIYDGYDVFGEGEDDGYDGYNQPAPAPQPTYTAPASTGISIGGSALEMKVVKPEHFESVPQIADHLLSKRTVVLNLENTSKETARRLIDFLSGVAYSIDGSLKKIASNAYVITPSNVDVGDAQLKSGARPAEVKEEAAEEGTEFGDM